MPHDRWVLEIKTIGRDRCLVCCEGDDPFVLYKQEILRYGIEEQAVLSAQTYESICEEVFRKRAGNRCMYLLEKQDYTEMQIRRKLKEGYYPDEIIDDTVEWLIGMHAIDDRRYAENYLRTNSCRYSRRVLEQKLTERGIGKALTEEILESEPPLMPDEKAQILRLLEKRHYDPEETSPQERDKIRQMLLRKGFGYELIQQMMQESSRDPEDEIKLK